MNVQEQIKYMNCFNPIIYQHNFPSVKEGLTDKESDCQIRRSVLRSNRLVRPQGFEPRTF